MRVAYSRTCITAYVTALLLTLVSALPLIDKVSDQFTEDSDAIRRSERSLSSSEESIEVLQAKKDILERLLKETDDKLSGNKDDDILTKRVGHDIVSRFTDHGPSADRPTKKSNSDPLPVDGESENEPRAEDMEKLKLLLELLEERHQHLETTTKKPQSALESLYKKLAELDIDIHSLLDNTDSSDADKRQRNYQDGKYPKEFIRK